MWKRDGKYELSGIVEVDDGYVGGATRNGKRALGTDKAKIVVALSKTENGAALFTRMQVMEDVTSKTLQQVVGKTVATGTKSNATAIRAIKTCPALRWTRKSMNLATCIGCTKPSAT